MDSSGVALALIARNGATGGAARCHDALAAKAAFHDLTGRPSANDSGNDPGSSGYPYEAGWWGLDLAAGSYVVGICQFYCAFADGFSITGGMMPVGARYVLNISTNATNDLPPTNGVPEPATWALALLALTCTGAGTRAGRRVSF